MIKWENLSKGIQGFTTDRYHCWMAQSILGWGYSIEDLEGNSIEWGFVKYQQGAKEKIEKFINKQGDQNETDRIHSSGIGTDREDIGTDLASDEGQWAGPEQNFDDAETSE